jgi:hypothetical protein
MRTEHVCIISALRSYTKAPVFTCGNVRKKVQFQTRVQEKKHLGCGKAIKLKGVGEVREAKA